MTLLKDIQSGNTQIPDIITNHQKQINKSYDKICFLSSVLVDEIDKLRESTNPMHQFKMHLKGVYGIDTKTKAKVWYSVSKSEKLDNVSLEEMACYKGCITEDGHNLTCGDKYEYNGILSKKEREMYPRKQSTTLRYLPLIKVECDLCKRIKFNQLLLKNGR